MAVAATLRSVPAYSYRPRRALPASTSTELVPSHATMGTQDAVEFQTINPARHLSTVSGAALTSISDWKPVSRKGHEWQKDAFYYDEVIAEIGQLDALTAELVASCRFPVVNEFLTATGEMERRPCTDIRPHRVMRAFTGPVGGQKLLFRRAALHMLIAGESNLVGLDLFDQHGQPQGISWEFLSPLEVRSEQKNDPANPGRKITAIFRSSGGNDDGEVEGTGTVARLWRQSPAYAAKATSPLKRVLPLCRELIVLSEVVDAISKSRLPAGILFIPEEMTFGSGEETAEDGSDASEIDEFIRQLIAHMRAPVENRTSAAGLVPLVVKGPAELGEKIKLIEISRNLDEEFQGLRAELIGRIATGMDAPPEMIQGKASLNHWSAYSVDNEFLDKHVAPLGDDIAEFLTNAYLRPMLVAKESMTPEETLQFRIAFDPRPLAQRSDEGAMASQGHEKMIVSDDAWLRSVGLTTGDKVSYEERKRRMLERIILAAPASSMGLVPLLFPELASFVEALMEAEVDRAARKQFPQRGVQEQLPAPLEAPATPALPDPEPGTAPPPNRPTEEPDHLPPGGGTPGPAQSAVDDLVRELTEAAEETLNRALTRGASRVLTRIHPERHATMSASLRNTPKAEVLGQLRSLDLEVLKVSTQELVGDAWDDFASKARTLVIAWAIESRAGATMAARVADAAVLSMVRNLDALTRSGIGRPLHRDRAGHAVPQVVVKASIEDALLQIAGDS